MQDATAIIHQRLYNQRLIGRKLGQPAEAVRWLGAVQSQDYAAAKWSLGLRLQDSTDADIERAFDSGVILRTHVMRPTWHFVLPADIRWMQALTAPRVKALLVTYDRKLELSGEVLAKCHNIIAQALQGGNYLTREEIAERLEANNIPARGQRLGHIVMHAELDALICSGPRRGKQFTYALLDERAPQASPIPREEALARLSLAYFTSHGPAQIKDFAWWSGLTVKDAQAGVDLMGSQLVRETKDGKTYWLSPDGGDPQREPLPAFLMSIYDEYIIAYSDRSALGGERYLENFQLGNTITGVMILNGQIIGNWKRAIKKGAVHLYLSPLEELTPEGKAAFEMAANLYGQFLQMPVVWGDP